MATTLLLVVPIDAEIDLDQVADVRVVQKVLDRLIMPFSQKRLASGKATVREIAERQGDNAELFITEYKSAIGRR